MKTPRLSLLILMGALALAGCGRKNFPVAPQPVTAPLGDSPTPNDAGASTRGQNFQRAARISSTGNDLTVSPAEVSRNPDAARKSFPLDFLLN